MIIPTLLQYSHPKRAFSLGNPCIRKSLLSYLTIALSPPLFVHRCEQLLSCPSFLEIPCHVLYVFLSFSRDLLLPCRIASSL
jgi:hypothetical protein